MENATYSEINAVKASFDDIYSEPDPRSYFRVLGGLDYTIPDLARPIFQQIVNARAKSQERPVTVLDLGCSYGINAALLRLPLERPVPLAELLQQIAASAFDASLPKEQWPFLQVRVLGLDVSEQRLDPGLVVGRAGPAEVGRDPGAGQECLGGLGGHLGSVVGQGEQQRSIPADQTTSQGDEAAGVREEPRQPPELRPKSPDRLAVDPVRPE